MQIIKRLSVLFFIILGLTTMSNSFSAVPQTINYQAQLNDAGGSPLNATVDITFTLYTDLGAPAGWNETHIGVQVTDGVFELELGSVTTFPVGIFGDPLFLGIQVAPDPEMTPRQPLLTTPYAFQAETVSTGAIDGAALAPSSVSTANIANGAVTAAKIDSTGLDADSVDGVEGLNIVTKTTGGVITNANLEVSGTGRFIASGQGVQFADGTTQTTASGASAAQKNVAVNCASETIQSAIDNAGPGGELVITVTGNCLENVVIRRDRVTLQGPGTITGQAAGQAAILVSGAHGVTISNLTVTTTPVDGDGILGIENAVIHIQASTIQGNRIGIVMTKGAFAEISNSNINSNITFGISIQDGAVGRITDTIVTESSTGQEAAVIVIRGGDLRMTGTNTITDATGRALGVFEGSTVRQDRGHTTISGLIFMSRQANVGLRDVTVNGNINVLIRSVLDIRDSTQPSVTPTLTGNVNLNNSTLLTGNNVNIVGDINSNGPANISFRPNTTVTGNMVLFGTSTFINTNFSLDGNLELNRGSSIDTGINFSTTGTITAFGSTVNLSADGISVGGRVSVGGASELLIGATTTINDQIECHGNSLVQFFANAVYGSGVVDPVINGFNGCRMTADSNVAITGNVELSDRSSLELNGGSTVTGNLQFNTDTGVFLSDNTTVTGNINFSTNSNLNVNNNVSVGGQIDFSIHSTMVLQSGATFSPTGPISYITNSSLRLDDSSILNISDQVFFDLHSHLGIGTNATLARASDADIAINFTDLSTVHIDGGATIVGSIEIGDISLLKTFGGGVPVTFNGDLNILGSPPSSISFDAPASAVSVINGHGINCPAFGIVRGIPTFVGGGSIGPLCNN